MRLKIAELNITIIITNMLNHPATSPHVTVLTSYDDMTRSPTEDLVDFVSNNYDDL